MLEKRYKRKECCKVLENLMSHQEKPELVINVCKICGCRHFELTVDSGKMGLAGTKMG